MAGKKPRTPVTSRIPALVFLIIALIFASAGTFLAFRSDRLERVCTEKAVGKVKNIYSKQVRTSGRFRNTTVTYYYITVEYNYGGKTYTVKPGNSVRKDRYKVGEKINVMINPDDDSEIYVEGQIRSTRIAVVLLLTISVVTGLVSLIFLLKYKKYKRRNEAPEKGWLQEQRSSEQDINDRFGR